MPKRTIFVLAGLALSIAVLAPAGVSAAATSHRVAISGVLDTVSSTGPLGAPGSKETGAGIFSATISGKRTKGASYQTGTWGPGLTLTGSAVAFNPSGSIRARFTSKFTTTAGGGLRYTSTLTVTGGTGSYKNAHGTLKASGAVLSSDSDATSFHATGRIKY